MSNTQFPYKAVVEGRESKIERVAEEAKRHLAEGVVRCDHLAEALDPQTVIDMVWVIRAARVLVTSMKYGPTDDERWVEQRVSEAQNVIDALLRFDPPDPNYVPEVDN